MEIPAEMPRLKGFRFPREIIAYAVWAYHRFALSTADVQDLLAERSLILNRETVRKWVNRIGRHFAHCIKHDRPAAADKWDLDEVVVPINSVKIWLWRAVDVLDIPVQSMRNAKAAKRFLKQLIARFGRPQVIITDKLRSYIEPICQLAPDADHRAHKGINNRIEGLHQPTRKRGKLTDRFKSPRQAQRFLSAHDQTNTILRPRRYRFPITCYRHARSEAFEL